MRRPILLVEDDAALRASLAEQLAAEPDLTVHVAASAAEAEQMLSGTSGRFDAVLLDIGLPDGNGRELCLRLRRQGLKIPILMLTGADAEADVVRGLDAGANDYIAKPFRLAELLARLRAQLRVFDNSEDAVLPLGPYLFHPADRLLLETARGRRIRLTDKEVRLLLRLHRARGEVVLRQTLLDEVWHVSHAAETHTVETHIHRLRRKIEPDPRQARLLLTAPGGYRLGRLEPEPPAMV